MSRLQDRRNAKRINGLRRDPRTGAGKLAKSERGYGGVLALDFTDNSVALYDPTTQANVAYSQGVTDGNGNFRGPHALLTYTSPSNKLTLQSDGFLRYQAHNLCLQSEDFATTWSASNTTVSTNATTDPLGGSAADLIDEATTTNQIHRRYQSITTIAGATYKFNVYFKPNERTAFAIRLGDGTNNYGVVFDSVSVSVTASNGSFPGSSTSISDVGGGWYLCTVTGTPAGTSTSFDICLTDSTSPSAWLTAIPRYNGTAGNGAYFFGAHVYRYPANTDYIKTTSAAKYALPLEYDTSGNCLGLLVEEERTNLCLYANDLTQAGSWTASNMTTAKTATGPDNVANSATTITATAGNATILQAITSTSAARVTSVYIKRRTGTGNIDLTQDNGSTWTTQAVDSTWTRFSLSSVTSANPTVGIRIVTSGDAVDVALFSHEVGAFVTSPIITYGAAATRAVDNISIATSAFPWSSTASSIYMSLSAIGNNSARKISIGDGGNNSNDAEWGGSSFTVGADGSSSISDPATDGTTTKLAAGWQANDLAVSLNGNAVVTDGSVTLPTASTTLRFGRQDMGNVATMHIKAIAYWPRRRADSELQTVTT